jgi:putative tricarboxylic transport membrane protein
MIDAMQVAFSSMFGLSSMGILLLGALIGVIFGALPGLGGVLALSIALPFTFGMDPLLSMFLYSGIISTVAFGGSVPAILLNTPGTPPNAATCLDGYPMAKRGESARALAISATACLVGSVGGAVVTISLLPLVKPIVFSFSPPEFFLLVFFGLITIAIASRRNLIKGLAGGCIGLMLSFIGFSEMFGEYRFTLGSNYLWDGLSMVPFIVGLFAVSEMIHYAARGGTTIDESVVVKDLDWRGQTVQGMMDVVRRPMASMRSCVIGAGIGVIPGLGGSVAGFLSYIAGMRHTRDEMYGHGSPEGIINSETANDAKEGGALLPTVAFGIPGSPDMAVLLGAFILHGMQPGPALLRDHLDLVYALLFGIVFSQVACSTLGLVVSPYIARLSLLNSKWVAPFVLTLVVLGTYMLRTNILDVAVAMFAGIFGFLLRRYGFSLVTVAIGFILGPLAERSLLQTLMISDGSWWIFLQRPISLVLVIFIVATMLMPLFQGWRRRSLEARV